MRPHSCIRVALRNASGVSGRSPEQDVQAHFRVAKRIGMGRWGYRNDRREFLWPQNLSCLPVLLVTSEYTTELLSFM